jgi:hypothetical protein
MTTTKREPKMKKPELKLMGKDSNAYFILAQANKAAQKAG